LGDCRRFSAAALSAAWLARHVPRDADPAGEASRPMNKPTFFARYALIILMAVFFFFPFALRGARTSLDRMKNDVKDWLPDDFPETSELDWFREHFMGEQFIVLSWDGCSGAADDQVFKTFIDKLVPEVPPSLRPDAEEGAPRVFDPAEAQAAGASPFVDKELGLYVRQLSPQESAADPQFIGERLGLFATADDHFNWGGLNEKWLRGHGDRWHYVTPEGELYRWNGDGSLMGAGVRAVVRLATGHNDPGGTLVKSLGPIDGPWYYANPQRLSARLVKSCTTGPGTLHTLTREGGPLEGKVELARQRLTGSLFGADGKQTCLILTLTDAAKGDLKRVLGRGMLGKPRGYLLRLAEESGLHTPAVPTALPPPISWLVAEPAVAPPVLHMGGPPVDNVAIDEEGQITLVRLISLSIAFGLGLTYACLRGWQPTIIVFFVGGISAILSLAAITWLGGSTDAVMMSMPSLVYVLGISGAVHLINYYRDAAGEHGLEGAPESALAHGWKPATLCAFTTALGLASLCTSELAPIRRFGTFSALGVLLTLLLLFAYLPSALQLWPSPPRRRSEGSRAAGDSWLARFTESFWESHARLMIRRPNLVAVGCSLLIAVMALGVFKIQTTIQLLKMFDGESRVIKDYQWMEGNLGKLVPLEVVLRVDSRAIRRASAAEAANPAPEDPDARFQLSFLERMELARNVQEAIEREFGDGSRGLVGRAVTAATFAPPLPEAGGGWQQAALRGGFSRRLEAYREDFFHTDYLRLERQPIRPPASAGGESETEAGGHESSRPAAELWRVSLRLGAFNDRDHGAFVGELQSVVEPILAAYRARDQVLRSIDSRREGKGYRGAKVYVLGAPLGASPSAAELRQRGPSASPSGPNDHVDQTAIFADTLRSLLKNAGVSDRDWHDPAFELPANWQATLAAQDCVVLAAADPRYDETLLKSHPAFVDARDHRFASPSARPTAFKRGDAVAAVYTGVVPVVYKAQRTLLESLFESTFWSFVTIAPVMMVLLTPARTLAQWLTPANWGIGIVAGLVSMLPNVFPLFVVFGILGHLGVPVDIGSMMTASVALGVAVDDTIHNLSWYRDSLNMGLSQKEAIVRMFKKCGTPMVQTTIIVGLGFSIFYFSTFTPTKQFGFLMLFILGAALIGDLIYLPALLAGPLGRFFVGTAKSPDESSSHLPVAESATPSTGLPAATPHVPARGERVPAILRHDKPHDRTGR
jgi:predicted RND superfamily exporter protein